MKGLVVSRKCGWGFHRPLPREGTETSLFRYYQLIALREVSTDHYPARGLKQSWWSVMITLMPSFHRPLPREGTETFY